MEWRTGRTIISSGGPFLLVILVLRTVFTQTNIPVTVHRLCHVRHSLDVILLIKLYKNTVDRAGDLVHMVTLASHDSHMKGKFDRKLVYMLRTDIQLRP